MVVSTEISDYFTNLVETLVTTQRLEEFFGKLKEGIIVWFIGLKYHESENQNDIVSKISECFSEISLPYEEAEIDRMHRISKLNETYNYQVQVIEIQTRCLPESTKEIWKWQK